MSNTEQSEDKSAVRERILSSMGPSYLSLVSILQSVLLGLLFVSQVMDRLRDDKLPFGFIQIILVASTFLVILAIWNELRPIFMCFRWISTWIDTVIPFGIAALQFALIMAIDLKPQYWFLSFALLLLGGSVVYLKMYGYIFKERWGADALNSEICTALGSHKWSNPLSYGVGALLAGLLCVSTWGQTEARPWQVCVVLAYQLFLFIWGEVGWRKIVVFAVK